MLILNRQVGSAIVIGEEQIRVTVLSVNRNKVRIGIQAPEGCEVDREEIWERKQAERKELE